MLGGSIGQQRGESSQKLIGQGGRMKEPATLMSYESRTSRLVLQFENEVSALRSLYDVWHVFPLCFLRTYFQFSKLTTCSLISGLHTCFSLYPDISLPRCFSWLVRASPPPPPWVSLSYPPGNCPRARDSQSTSYVSHSGVCSSACVTCLFLLCPPVHSKLLGTWAMLFSLPQHRAWHRICFLK